MAKISFIKSDDRNYNIERSLSLLKGEIMAGLRGARNIVIKPNCATENDKQAATHVEALRSVLEFISPFAKTQITIAEGTGIGETLNAFKNFGYLDLQETYDFTITDLNDDDFEYIELYDKNGQKFKTKIAKTITSSDYLISLALPKTHNNVLFTGAIKNTAVAAVLRENNPQNLATKLNIKKNYKNMVHQGNYYTNLNIKTLHEKTAPHLSVLDAYEIMEGDGPINGNILPGHFAVASSNPLAADWLTSKLIGLDLDDIGYLKLIDDEDNERSDYFVTGDAWQNFQLKAKLPPNFSEIKNWQIK